MIPYGYIIINIKTKCTLDINHPLSISFVRRSIKAQKESIVHPAAVGLNAINNQIENQETDNIKDTINNSVILTPYI